MESERTLIRREPSSFQVPKFGSSVSSASSYLHQCSIVGCEVVVQSTQSVCPKHKCPLCKRPSWSLSSLKMAVGKRHCSDHGCPRKGCDQPKSQWNLFCDNHKCSFEIAGNHACQKLSVVGKTFCAFHACRECPNSILCRNHPWKT